MHWPREITKAKLSPFLFTSFYLTMETEGEKGNLGKFGQVWTSLGKLGQVGTRQQIRKMGEKAERIRKENKNLSGDGGGEEGGGESRV